MAFNTTSGKMHVRTVDDIKKHMNCNWIFHQKREVDVAIIPFEFNINDDIMFIPDNLFLSPNELFEGYDIFFLSYQPGIEIKQRISPILRRGAISLINEDATFYIDAAAFPGNSGSPVFLKPSMMLNEAGTFSVNPGGKFIGVIGEYIPYAEVAISVQTHRPRIVFEENTGLSKVWSVFFINEIIESEVFKQQLQSIMK
jgi:hypothetical protein